MHSYFSCEIKYSWKTGKDWKKIIKLVQDALHENRIKRNFEVTLTYSTSITRQNSAYS